MYVRDREGEGKRESKTRNKERELVCVCVADWSKAKRSRQDYRDKVKISHLEKNPDLLLQRAVCVCVYVTPCHGHYARQDRSDRKSVV